MWQVQGCMALLEGGTLFLWGYSTSFYPYLTSVAGVAVASNIFLPLTNAAVASQVRAAAPRTSSWSLVP